MLTLLIRFVQLFAELLAFRAGGVALGAGFVETLAQEVTFGACGVDRSAEEIALVGHVAEIPQETYERDGVAVGRSDGSGAVVVAFLGQNEVLDGTG
jgi:hypothetical protein